jgi:hypothetical protein
VRPSFLLCKYIIGETMSKSQRITITQDRINEIISITAYHFYEQRGKEPGHELDDWLKAEAEINPVKKPSLRKLAEGFLKNKVKPIDISVNTDV